MAAEISGLKVTVRVECPRCSAKYEATFVPPPARIVPPAVAVRGLWSPLAPSHRDPSGAGGRGVIVLTRATDLSGRLSISLREVDAALKARQEGGSP